MRSNKGSPAFVSSSLMCIDTPGWVRCRDSAAFEKERFGDAGFVGSLPGIGVSDTIVSVTATADGHGYAMLSKAGRVYSFGDAPYYGDPVGSGSPVPGSGVGVFAHAGS